MDNNNSRRTTYQIVDNIPDIIRTEIPLIDLFSVGIYYLTAPFYLIYRAVKNKESIKAMFKRKKRETFKGREKSYALNFSLDNVEFNFSDKEKILRTTNTYFEKKEAIELLKELDSQGFKFDRKRLSKSFSIKRKVEIIEGEADTETRVLYSYPQYADKISKIFKIKEIKKWI